MRRKRASTALRHKRLQVRCLPTIADNAATHRRGGTTPLAVGSKRFTDKESGNLASFDSAATSEQPQFMGGV